MATFLVHVINQGGTESTTIIYSLIGINRVKLTGAYETECPQHLSKSKSKQ